MNIVTLASEIGIKNNIVTLNGATLNGAFKNVLEDHCRIKSLTINNAKQDVQEKSLCITGKTNFLNCKNLPLSAIFYINETGDVDLEIRIHLISDIPNANSWRFSRSFKELPTSFNYDTQLPKNFTYETNLEKSQTSFLDSLKLSNSYFIVCSTNKNCDDFSVPLQKGLNFVSSLKAQGTLGVLETSINKSNDLILYGHINIPLITDKTQPLTMLDSVWNHPEVPGIHLQCKLSGNTQVGKIALTDTLFRVYSPISQTWLDKNNQYAPKQGYSASLGIENSDITMDVWADIKWNFPEALFVANCDGLSIKNLTDLAGISGGKLDNLLPTSLQSQLKGLSKIELIRFSFGLTLNNSLPSLSFASFTVGVPDLNWQVWQDHFEVNKLSCRFIIDSPFSTAPQYGITVNGEMDLEGVPIEVSAKSEDDFTLYARLGEAQTIPLSKIINRYAPAIPKPSDLTIDNMVLSVSPGHFYGFSMLMASGDNSWKIPLGPKKLTVSDVSMNLLVPKTGSTTGSISAAIAFSKELKFNVGYDLPGDIQIRGVFPRARLSQLIKQLSNQKLALPKDFDLEFEYAQVLMTKNAENYNFSLATEIEDLGLFAFELRKIGSRWGYAAAIDLSIGAPSSLPGLSAINKIEKAFGLKGFTLVASSFQDARFAFPNMSQFNTPALATKKVSLPAHTSGVVSGINLFSKWQLDHQNKQQKMLKSFLSLPSELDITIQISENPSAHTRMFTSLETRISGHPASLEMGALMENGELGLFLTGSMQMNIHKSLQTFHLNTAFVPNGAFLSADMIGNKPVHFSGFNISDLALQIGVSYEGIPSLGIAASISTKAFDSSLAIFFDSTQPSRSMVAGSLSDLSLKNVVQALVSNNKSSAITNTLSKIALSGTQSFHVPASNAKAFNERNSSDISKLFKTKGKIHLPSTEDKLHLVEADKNKKWFITDKTTMRHYQVVRKGNNLVISVEAQFYCAPEDTYIGTKRFPEGFYVNGRINVLGFHAQATIQINANKGIAVDAQADKIVIANKTVFSLSAASGKGGPKISISTFKQPELKVKEFRNPHIYINGKLELLGITESTFISISQSGAIFNLNGSLDRTLKYKLSGHFANSRHLSVDGDIKVGIGSINLGALGKIKIKSDVEGEVEISFDGRKITATCKAGFEALGQHHRISRFKLNVKTAAFKHLPKILEREMEKVLKLALKDAEKWAKAVDKGLIKGVKDTKKVLKSEFKKSDKEIKKISKSVSKEVNKTAKSVEKGVGKAVKSIGKVFHF